MGDSNDDKSELSCPECDESFTATVPDDSEVPIPCPECGAPTPVEPDSSDGEETDSTSTAHGIPSSPETGDEAASTSRENPAVEGSDSTLQGKPGETAKAVADDEEVDPDDTAPTAVAESTDSTDEADDSVDTAPTAASRRDDSDADDASSTDGDGPSRERTPGEQRAIDQDRTLHGVGPVAPGNEDSDVELAPDDDSDPKATDSGGISLDPGGPDSESAEEEAGSDEDTASLDPGSKWSTPPPQDAVEEADEETHGAVTAEVDSVPDILAEADAPEMEARDAPEPAYDTEPEGTSLVGPSSDDQQTSESQESTSDEETATDSDAVEDDPSRYRDTDRIDPDDTQHGIAGIQADDDDLGSDTGDDETDDLEEANGDDRPTPAAETDEIERSTEDPSVPETYRQADGADDTETEEGRDEASKTDRKGSPDDGPSEVSDDDRQQADSIPQASEDGDDETPSDSDTPDTDAASPEEGDPFAESGNLERDAPAVRTGDEPGFRVDPSTNLEVAADEAMSQATESARQSAAPELADPSSVRDLREKLPDDSYRLRVENYVYTGIDRTRLAQLIADGKIVAVDALAREHGPWLEPTEHPALEQLRRETVDETHELLEAAPDSQSREIDLEAIEESAEASRSQPPPVPSDGASETDDEAPESEAQRQSEPRPSDAESGSGGAGSRATVLAIVLFGIAGIIALVTYSSMGPSSEEGAEEPNSREVAADEDGDATSSDEATASNRRPEAMAAAVEAARATVGEAISTDLGSADGLERRVENALSNEDYSRASDLLEGLWPKRRDDQAFALRYIETLRRAGRYERARRVAVEGVQTFDDASRFRSEYRRALRDDPALNEYRDVDIVDHLYIRTMDVVERGDYPAYRIEGADGKPTHLFLPASPEFESWRDQIAAWRLCSALSCNFDIPRTRAAYISAVDLKKRLQTDSAAESPSPDPAQLDWTKLDWTKRNGERVVRGALRRWPEDVEPWPIEASDAWRRWVSVYPDDIRWEASVATALDARTDLELDPDARDRILQTTGDWTVRHLASQLSSILTFDYLTNNWGRFERQPESYGMSNHVGPDRFVTYQTDTVFQRRGSRRVEGRFNWCFRFSEDLVTSLRLFQRAATADMLYPDGTDAAGKLRIFWRQRKRVLNRVNHLIGKHGRDAILAFE